MTERYEVVLELGEAGTGVGETWSEAQALSQAELIIEALESEFVGKLVKVGEAGQRFTIDEWST